MTSASTPIPVDTKIEVVSKPVGTNKTQEGKLNGLLCVDFAKDMQRAKTHSLMWKLASTVAAVATVVLMGVAIAYTIFIGGPLSYVFIPFTLAAIFIKGSVIALLLLNKSRQSDAIKNHNQPFLETLQLIKDEKIPEHLAKIGIDPETIESEKIRKNLTLLKPLLALYYQSKLALDLYETNQKHDKQLSQKTETAAAPSAQNKGWKQWVPFYKSADPITPPPSSPLKPKVQLLQNLTTSYTKTRYFNQIAELKLQQAYYLSLMQRPTEERKAYDYYDDLTHLLRKISRDENYPIHIQPKSKGEDEEPEIYSAEEIANPKLSVLELSQMLFGLKLPVPSDISTG